MNEHEQDLARQEEELLGLHLMGDIREDVEFLGLRMKDIILIIGLTLVVGLIPFLLPFSILFKIGWVLLVFMVTTISFMMRVPYRLRRMYVDRRYQPARGTGELLDDILGMQEDGWFYTSTKGNIIQILYELDAPPWGMSTLSNKRQRLNQFAAFIRASLKERFRIDIYSEQVPNYQYENWDRKQEQQTASIGIEKLKHDRIAMWKDQVKQGEAKRSVYILRLTIRKSDLPGKQRDDEPVDLTKEELKRYRMIAELREKQARVLSFLEQSGHRCSLLSGYALTELLGRAWDYTAWNTWKNQRGDWSEDEHEQIEQELVLDLAQDEQAQPNLHDEARLLESNDQVAATNITDTENKLVPSSKDRRSTPKSMRWRKLVVWLRLQIARLIEALCKPIRLLRSRQKQIDKKKHEKADVIEQQPLSNAIEDAVDQAHHAGMSSSAQAAQHLPISAQPSNNLWLLTSPTSTGKSFLTVNVAVGMSSYEHPVHIVDLSPDQGCKSLLNPLPVHSDVEGWHSYISKHAPGLTLWLPDAEARPDRQFITEHIQRLKQQTLTLVDLPWSYPARESLLAVGFPIAVVDGDYHHWLMWERVTQTQSWKYAVWLNSMDEELEQVYRSLMSEAGWQASQERVFPYVAHARHWSYQGVPAAAMLDDVFTLDGGGREEKIA